MARQRRIKFNLNNVHQELLSNCNGFIARLNQAEKTMTAGYVHQQASALCESMSSSGGSITIDPQKVDSEDLRILTHAFIIQEWHLFLDNVFVGVVEDKLCHAKKPNLPRMNIKLDFEDVDLSTIAKTRRYIFRKLKETFSFEGYDEKIDRIKKIVDLTTYYNTELPFIKKNVIVRNIFQHQKGIVSQDDLSRLGGSLILLDDANVSVSYNAGEKLKMSKPEINELFQTLGRVTNNLQVIQ